MIGADRAARLQGAVDNTFGETLQIVPMASVDPNARANTDPNRDPWTFTGIWEESSKHNYLDARVLPDRDSRKFDGQHIMVKFTASVLPYRPQKRDQITRALTGITYEVGDIWDLDSGRTMLRLTGAR